MIYINNKKLFILIKINKKSFWCYSTFYKEINFEKSKKNYKILEKKNFENILNNEDDIVFINNNVRGKKNKKNIQKFKMPIFFKKKFIRNILNLVVLKKLVFFL